MQTAEKYVMTQNVFEALFQAMIDPGTVHEVPGEKHADGGHRVVLAVAETILGWEASFCMKGNDDERLERIVRELTAPPGSDAATDECAFSPERRTSGQAAQPETPDRPGKGLTTIYLVEGFNRGADSCSFLLKGPGISPVVSLSVEGVSRDELRTVQKANKDVSPSEDAIFVDRRGNIACIPRSARIIDLRP